MRFIDLTDPDPLPDHKAEKVMLLIEFVPEGSDHWGVLESMRGTSWEGGIKEIPTEALSHALHGRLHPLTRALGRDPRASARRVNAEEGECALKGNCIGWKPPLCRPGGFSGKGYRRKEGPPECYEPPLSEDTPKGVVETFMRVLSAWREGRHVVVVRGDGFNLG